MDELERLAKELQDFDDGGAEGETSVVEKQMIGQTTAATESTLDDSLVAALDELLE